jgi:tetratricopeptide (TPR) repeat protein
MNKIKGGLTPYKLPKQDLQASWIVAQRCWARNPNERPHAPRLVEDLSLLAAAAAPSQTAREVKRTEELEVHTDGPYPDARSSERPDQLTPRIRSPAENIMYLRKKLPAYPATDPECIHVLYELAVALRKSYLHSKDPGVLDEAISYLDNAHDLHSKSSATIGYERGQALYDRYRLYKRENDRKQAVEQHRRVLELRPPGHPQRAASLRALALSLRGSRNPQELREALDLLQSSANLLPEGQRSREECSSDLVEMHWEYIQRMQWMTTYCFAYGYDTMIRIYRELLNPDRTPAQHIDRDKHLLGLVGALQGRYKRSMSKADLDEVISIHRARADELLLAKNMDNSITTGDLANALHVRLADFYSAELLVECIAVCRRLLVLNPKDRLAKKNLALALRFRSWKEDDQEAWYEALRLTHSLFIPMRFQPDPEWRTSWQQFNE